MYLIRKPNHPVPILIMTKFSYKLHRQGTDVLLAISDSAIVGKTFEDGEISVTISEDFYADSRCDDKKAIDLVKSSTIVNAIGNQIVNLLIREKFIDKTNILVISGVPHAQIVAMN